MKDLFNRWFNSLKSYIKKDKHTIIFIAGIIAIALLGYFGVGSESVKASLESAGFSSTSLVLMFSIILLAWYMWGKSWFKREPLPTDYWYYPCGGWLAGNVMYKISKEEGKPYVDRVGVVLNEFWAVLREIYAGPIAQHLEITHNWSHPFIHNLYVQPDPLPEGHDGTMYHPSGVWTLQLGCSSKLIAGELHSIMRNMLNVYDKPSIYRDEAVRAQEEISRRYNLVP